MPTLTLTAPGPLVANIHIDGTTIRDVLVTERDDGLIEIEFGGVDVGARIIGRVDIVHAMIIDADMVLARLRGGGR